MMNTYVICTVVSLVAIFTPSLAQPKPSFCRTYDCPRFTSVNAGTYEIRTMTQNTWWAESTLMLSGSNMNWFQSSSVFRKLFNYISGTNVAGKKMEMTVPVLTRVTDQQNGQFAVTMMFFISSTEQPPASTDTRVSITSIPAGTRFYVRTFQKLWWASSGDYSNNINALKRDIGDASLYNNVEAYNAGYEPPYYFGWRRYEVSLRAN